MSIYTDDLPQPHIIHGLVTSGDVQAVADLLEGDSSCVNDMIDEKMFIPIIEAIENNNFDMVKLLIDHGAFIHGDCRDGYAPSEANEVPIHVAVKSGNAEMVKLLIAHGADINNIVCGLDTPLIHATFSGHFEIAKILVDSGCDLEEGRREGTALYEAVDNGYYEIAELLLKNGANLNIVRGRYGSILNHAVRSGSLEMVKLLINYGADLHSDTSNTNPLYVYEPPLHISSSLGELEMCNLLIEKGADVNSTDKDNRTPLHNAVHARNIDVVKLLLVSGADVDIETGIDSPFNYILSAVKEWHENGITTFHKKSFPSLYYTNVLSQEQIDRRRAFRTIDEEMLELLSSHSFSETNYPKEVDFEE